MPIEAVLTPPAGVSKEEMDRIAKAIDDANHNRKGSRQPLVELLEQHPELVRLGGSIAEKAEKTILEAATGGNVLVEEITRQQLVVHHSWFGEFPDRLGFGNRVDLRLDTRQTCYDEPLEDMRQKMAGPGDGDLERLVIDRVVLSWLSLHSAKAWRAGKWKKDLSFEAADFWDRHVSGLNNDFLKAVKT